LDLCGNQIKAVGSQHIAQGLKDKTVTFILNLDLFSIYLFFFYIKILTTLDLQYNKIGDKGTQYLADALQNNKVIRIFSLYYLN